MSDMRFRNALAVIALVVAGALGGCAAPPSCASGGCTEDEKITEQVKAALSRHSTLSNQVSVRTIDGVVYLTGQVATELQRSIATDAAQSVPGVTKVVDNTSLPPQGF